jgi:hypothetical protein
MYIHCLSRTVLNEAVVHWIDLINLSSFAFECPFYNTELPPHKKWFYVFIWGRKGSLDHRNLKSWRRIKLYKVKRCREKSFQGMNGQKQLKYRILCHGKFTLFMLWSGALIPWPHFTHFFTFVFPDFRFLWLEWIFYAPLPLLNAWTLKQKNVRRQLDSFLKKQEIHDTRLGGHRYIHTYKLTKVS